MKTGMPSRKHSLRSSLIGLSVLGLAGCLSEPTLDGGDSPDGAPCVPKPVATGFRELTLTHNGLERKYGIYAPKDLVQPAALVLMLHGGGGSGSFSLLQRTGMALKAEAEGFLLVAPSAISGNWNAGDCCGDPSIDDVGFIDSLLNVLQEQVCLDPKRVFATGHSNGGMMCYRLACDLSHRIAAVAPSAGFLLDVDCGTADAPQTPCAPVFTCQPVRPVPLLSVHGTADTCAPIQGGPVSCGGSRLRPPVSHGIDAFRQFNGCNGQGTRVFERGDARCLSYGPCSEGSDVRYCTVSGGGHVWFGNLAGRGEGYSDDLVMQDAAWEFFLAHPMPPAPPG